MIVRGGESVNRPQKARHQRCLTVKKRRFPSCGEGMMLAE
jgi:hypothetical protein